MAEKQAKIFKVNTKPATGEVGGIYFVKSEKKTYIYSESGWEPYNNADEATHATNADKATKVTNKLTAGTKTYDGSAAVSLTKADLGLGNVDNTADKDKKVYEANLQWGGKNFVGDFAPIDAALISTLGANRFAFMGANTIDIEYSRDAGKTWLDYGATDAEKVALLSRDSVVSMQIGKSTRTEDNKSTPDCMLRVTVKCRLSEANGITKLYTVLRKICILASTNGNLGCYCTIQVSKNGSLDTWENVVENVSIDGWSGFNIINIPSTLVGAYIDNTGSNNYIRFIFGITDVGTYNNGVTNGLSILNIYAYGGVGWNTPSNMARNGHVYRVDSNQLAIFPNSISTVHAIYEAGQTLSQKYAPKSIETTVNNKVDKVSGKQLSTNDYTTAEKNKLAGLENAEALTNDEIDNAIK